MYLSLSNITLFRSIKGLHKIKEELSRRLHEKNLHTMYILLVYYGGQGLPIQIWPNTRNTRKYFLLKDWQSLNINRSLHLKHITSNSQKFY